MPRIETTGRLALLGLLCVAALAAAEPMPPAAPRVILTVWQQVNERCRALAVEPLPPYPWPIAPFNRQHPVRGYFGDPRTVISGDGEGAYSFHNGIDISAWTGNHVFPVVSGIVSKVSFDRIVVHTADGRRFQYIHVAPTVREGSYVVASRTMLGTIRPGWNHVHLSEIRDGCAVNPLAPGHLTPYVDTTRPAVGKILFENAALKPLPPLELSGQVRVVAEASDEPALSNPFPWGSVPVAPALVRWTLETLSGRVVTGGTAADFRFSEPPRSQFCQVYAPGTEQNFAAVVGTFHWGKPGRYFYELTPNLDTARLRRGRYRLTVSAADTAGNMGLETTLIAVSDRALTFVPEPAPDRRCTAAS